jgi:hypothetical protein
LLFGIKELEPRLNEGALADKPPAVAPVAGRLATNGAILKAGKFPKPVNAGIC